MFVYVHTFVSVLFKMHAHNEFISGCPFSMGGKNYLWALISSG